RYVAPQRAQAKVIGHEARRLQIRVRRAATHGLGEEGVLTDGEAAAIGDAAAERPRLGQRIDADLVALQELELVVAELWQRLRPGLVDAGVVVRAGLEHEHLLA